MKIGLPVSRSSYSSIFSGQHVDERLHRIEKVERRIERRATDAEIRRHHALAGNVLEDTQDLFTLPERVEEDSQRADVHGVRTQPDENAN